MHMASSSSRIPQQLFALCTAVATCLLVAGCGDDGTDSLSSCPDYRIQADKAGVQHCAPRAGSGGTPPVVARAGSGAGGGSSQQPNRQPSAGKPAAGSGAAAIGGTASVPPIPKGGIWTCIQVSSTCSCAMTDTPVDSCTKPLPGCCMLVREGDKYSACVCYGENSVACGAMKRDPMNYVPVATCPPS